MALVEGINGAGMTYQGSVSTAQIRTEAQPKMDDTATEITANQLAKDTMSLDTKAVDEDGAGSQNGGQGAQQQVPNEKQQERIKKAVEDINRRMWNSEAIFGIHDATNRVTIKIVDKSTREVIKELPPEKTLDMLAKAWELAGLMVDERR